MGVDSVNWGNVTTASTYVDATSELMPGERATEQAIPLNAKSVAVEGSAKGPGTNTPLVISQKSNANVSDYIQGQKAEVVDKAVEVDESAAELLNQRMAEESQPKV